MTEKHFFGDSFFVIPAQAGIQVLSKPAADTKAAGRANQLAVKTYRRSPPGSRLFIYSTLTGKISSLTPLENFLSVIPAQAGIQMLLKRNLDPRLRGDDRIRSSS